MSLAVQCTKGSLDVNGTVLNAPNSTVVSGSGADFVYLDANSEALVYDNSSSNGGSALAAAISTGAQPSPSTTKTYSPPTQSMYQVYYNQSYRWQLVCPGGSVGVRI
jgi:hypothetical protein